MRLDATIRLLNEVERNIDPLGEMKASFESADELIKAANIASMAGRAGRAISGMWPKIKTMFNRAPKPIGPPPVRTSGFRQFHDIPGPAPVKPTSVRPVGFRQFHDPTPNPMSWKTKSLMGLGAAGAGYGGMKALTSPINPSGPIEYGRELEKLQSQGGIGGLAGSFLVPFLNPMDSALHGMGFNEKNMLNRVRSMGYDVTGNPMGTDNEGFGNWLGNWFGNQQQQQNSPFFNVIGIDHSGQPVYDMTEQGRMADSMLQQQLFDHIGRYRNAQMRGLPVDQVVQGIKDLRSRLALMPEMSRSVDMFNRYLNANPLTGIQPFASNQTQSANVQPPGSAPEMNI